MRTNLNYILTTIEDDPAFGLDVDYSTDNAYKIKKRLQQLKDRIKNNKVDYYKIDSYYLNSKQYGYIHVVAKEHIFVLIVMTDVVNPIPNDATLVSSITLKRLNLLKKSMTELLQNIGESYTANEELEIPSSILVYNWNQVNMNH